MNNKIERIKVEIENNKKMRNFIYISGTITLLLASLIGYGLGIWFNHPILLTLFGISCGSVGFSFFAEQAAKIQKNINDSELKIKFIMKASEDTVKNETVKGKQLDFSSDKDLDTLIDFFKERRKQDGYQSEDDDFDETYPVVSDSTIQPEKKSEVESTDTVSIKEETLKSDEEVLETPDLDSTIDDDFDKMYPIFDYEKVKDKTESKPAISKKTIDYDSEFQHVLDMFQDTHNQEEDNSYDEVHSKKHR